MRRVGPPPRPYLVDVGPPPTAVVPAAGVDAELIDRVQLQPGVGLAPRRGVNRFRLVPVGLVRPGPLQHPVARKRPPPVGGLIPRHLEGRGPAPVLEVHHNAGGPHPRHRPRRPARRPLICRHVVGDRQHGQALADRGLGVACPGPAHLGRHRAAPTAQAYAMKYRSCDVRPLTVRVCDAVPQPPIPRVAALSLDAMTS